MLREMEDTMSFERRNKMARKMTPSQVADMRLAYSQGATQGALCSRFGVSVGTVGRIVRGESWVETAAVRMPSPREQEDMLQRLMATQAAVNAAPELRGMAEEFEAGPRAAGRKAPPSLLDGADAPSEGDGSGLSELEARAQAYGVDIERLRAPIISR